jgi:outer membrane receptor protein involved in Fe transport
MYVTALILLAAALETLAGTTGKIAGRARDAESGEPLVGVSVMIEGTTTGVSSDVDGNYVLVNLPPGSYVVVASGVGFQRKRFSNVKVSVDFTTRLDIQLSTDVIALETVEVRAEAPMVRRDLTSSQAVIDATAIEALPVENVAQVLTLQAGVVQGTGGEIHIRGGRSTEIQYTVNGVSVINPYDNTGSVAIATNAIEELSVVAGTFNAEYGNALSGVVNTVTKEGGPEYRGTLSAYTGDYASGHTDPFFNIDDVDPLNNSVVEGTVSGPVPGLQDVLTFFASGRFQENRGWLYGVREQRPEDYLFRSPLDPNDITIVSTGDNAIVAMNPSRGRSATGKLSFAPTPVLKFRYDIVWSDGWLKPYNHDLKYNPDAQYNRFDSGLLNALEFRHAVNPRTFYTVKGSWNISDYQQYLYALTSDGVNPVEFHAGMTLDTSAFRPDHRYQPVHKLSRATEYTFLAGGTLPGHSYQRTETFGGKADITSQVSASHEVKGGLELRSHTLEYEGFEVLYDTSSSVYNIPTITGTGTTTHTSYKKTPLEFSAYVQDKMEFESIILNVGLRYDYFAPDSRYGTSTIYPSPYSPTLPAGVDTAGLLADAEPKHMVSPRIGVSFPITDRGIIHFSYGHFYQIPPFAYLYANPDFVSDFSSGTPTFGNANLDPEQTVTYEVGLQQQLSDNISFNLTAFYKDVRDLLASEQIRISGDQTYFKYVNKDYANIKGITFTFTKRRTASDLLGVTLDYTFQVGEGNEVNSDAFFVDLSSGRQTEKVPVPLSWDQTHTLNATVSVGRPSDWNVSAIARLGTGLPYTPEVTSRTLYLEENSGRKPSQKRVDLLMDKTFAFSGFAVTAFLKVYNVFDTRNERVVYNDTGRSTYTLDANSGTAKQTNALAETVPGVHSATEYFQRPHYYDAPRQILIGAAFEF